MLFLLLSRIPSKTTALQTHSSAQLHSKNHHSLFLYKRSQSIKTTSKTLLNIDHNLTIEHLIKYHLIDKIDPKFAHDLILKPLEHPHINSATSANDKSYSIKK